MFLNKAFITAWLSSGLFSTVYVNWVGWPWLSHLFECTTGHPPTLCLSILFWLWSLNVFEINGTKWTRGIASILGFSVGGPGCYFAESIEEAEATLFKLHDHCEQKKKSLLVIDDLFFHGGFIWNTFATSALLALFEVLFKNGLEKYKFQPLRSQVCSCLAFGRWWISPCRGDKRTERAGTDQD